MMKKVRLLAGLLAISLLAGCGGQAAKEIDAQALAESLVEEGIYVEKPTSLGADLAKIYYELEDGVNVWLYMGTGKTQEEVAVFEAPDADTAEKQLAHVQSHKADQVSAVEDYQPEEVERLNNKSVLEQKGKYVIYCVSDDSGKAKEIVEKAFE